MSTGGVFQLVSNVGIQDKLIMDTDGLNNRIKNISLQRLKELRQKNPGKSEKELLEQTDYWTPTIAELEKTHIVFVSSTFRPFVAMAREYSKTPPRQGIPSLGGTFAFTLPIIGEFVNDAVLYVKLTGLSTVSALDKVRFTEYLGHRLAKRVAFKVRNHELDYYTSDTYNAYYQYKVPINKETGYLRGIGQEIPKVGLITADPTVDEVREYRYFGDGPQTFKQTQPTIELWIPILFWFKDIQCALPNFLLPQNQTDIEIQFEEQANLVAFSDYGGGGAYNVPRISECYMYLNHIFILPEIYKIFASRFGFQLIRVHRTHTEIVTDSEKQVRLHQLKWPIECLYIGFRPRVNLTNSQRWYKNTHIIQRTVKEAVVTGVATIQVNNAVYLDERHVISGLELKAHDTVIYPMIQPEFYNNYMPYRYGAVIKTPKDLGWYMMTFGANPGEYQPSGHFNVSRSRELYLNYNSATDPDNNLSIIRPANPVDLIVLADCINFVLYKDNNMVLRFST